MRSARNILLVSLMLMLVASIAFAQGMGMGGGSDDLTQRGPPGPPAPDNFLLLDTGGRFTLNGGGRIKCNAC